MIFKPKFFFRRFSLNTEVHFYYINFRDPPGPRFLSYNETKIFFCFLMPYYNSPRARYLIRKFWENRGYAKLLNREIKTCILKVFS